MARVTLVVNNFDEGSETFLHALARQLVEIGHEVTVHVLLDGRTSMRTGESFDVPEVRRSSALPAARSRSFLAAVLRLFRRHPRPSLTAMWRAGRTFGIGGRAAHAAAVATPLLVTRPDVVHVAFSGIGVAVADGLRLLDRDTRLIVSCRGTGELVAPELDPSVGPRLGELLERADAVHVVAAVVGDTVRRLGARERSIHLIRPAVDEAVLLASPSRRERSGPLEVVTVARLHWIKGLEVQLAAAIQLVDQGVDVHWTVVGDGPDRAEAELRVRLAGMASNMSFAGPATPTRVQEAVAASDVLVSSSWSEGTSNSVLEAMALGVPVVSSAAGGMTEVLTNGVDALVFPVGDANSLACALRLVAERPQLAGAMAVEARRTVCDRFTVDRQKMEWARLYDEVLAVPSGRMA